MICKYWMWSCYFVFVAGFERSEMGTMLWELWRRSWTCLWDDFACLRTTRRATRRTPKWLSFCCRKVSNKSVHYEMIWVISRFDVISHWFVHWGYRNNVVACVKHFVGDGGTDKGINEGNTIASYEDLEKIHIPPYLNCLAQGVSTVMASYSSWNGTRLHADRFLLTEILKEKLGFKVCVNLIEWKPMTSRNKLVVYALS